MSGRSRRMGCCVGCKAMRQALRRESMQRVLKMEKLLRKNDLCEIYGVTKYEAENIMRNVERVNLGRSNIRPRWATTASKVDAYLSRRTVAAEYVGLDHGGKLKRR